MMATRRFTILSALLLIAFKKEIIALNFSASDTAVLEMPAFKRILETKGNLLILLLRSDQEKCGKSFPVYLRFKREKRIMGTGQSLRQLLGPRLAPRTLTAPAGSQPPGVNASASPRSHGSQSRPPVQAGARLQ